MSSLEGNTEYEVIREWLQENLVSLRSDMSVCKDEVLTRWHQGAVQVLEGFLEKSAKATEIQHSLREKKRLSGGVAPGR